MRTTDHKLTALSGTPPLAGVDRRDLEAAGGAGDLLRFVSPVQFSQRIVTQRTDIGATVLESGELVALLLGAANRDPDAFTEPHRLDLGRTPNPHLGFGSGSHACLGAALARLEASIMVPAVLDRWPDLEINGRVRWRPTFVLRGLAALPVHWNQTGPQAS